MNGGLNEGNAGNGMECHGMEWIGMNEWIKE